LFAFFDFGATVSTGKGFPGAYIMEDAAKKASLNHLISGQEPSQPAARDEPKSRDAFVGYVDDSTTRPAAPKTEPEPSLSTSAKALDRWFRERQKQQGAPNLLEIPNEALVKNAGPLQITGNITFVGEDGMVSYANHLTLCRCGQSRSKPNCDNQHLDSEFFDAGKIHEASDALQSGRPAKMTLSCIKDGPITFRGRLKVLNSSGQECTKIRGALCRCGHSTNKPFCDGSHARNGFKTG
jgi:CDGSH-type Zn-finger protein